MKIAALIDPLEQLDLKKDTSLVFLKAAEALNMLPYYFTLNDLSILSGKAFAQCYSLSFRESKSGKIEMEKGISKNFPLSAFDFILMRKDPPFNLEYIYATYALELAENEGVVVSNKPQSLRDANEKCFLYHFPQCTPKTLVSRNINQLQRFWEEHQDVVYKPLSGMGGRSIFRVDKLGRNLPVILESLTYNQTESIMAQCFIPSIQETGDKRILVINGVPVDFGLARIPAKNDIRGNLAAGASSRVVPLTQRDRWLCQEIAPKLRAKGLHFVGVDVIGDYITEINVTSPTCLREISKETGIPIASNYIEFLMTLKK